MNEIDTRLALEFDQDAEWKAYQTRVARILTKRNAGKAITKEETAILADYQIASKLSDPPHNKETGAIIPPILYGYAEAEEAFALTRAQLLGLRSRGCPAFAGNLILTATLADELTRNPQPEAVPGGWHTGRKGKLTPELQASIVASLAAVPVLSTVAGAHGLDPKTLKNWRERGEQGGPANRKYLEFFRETEAAMNQAFFTLARDVASDPDWRAKLSILERTAPQIFGRVNKTELTGKDGGAIQGNGFAPAVVNVVIEQSAEPKDEQEPQGDSDG